jgi:prepilin-type N-terminal cleavage/methylation domain-containing protein
MATANHKCNAFSLVELVMMLAIISILAAIAGPRYANSLALYRATATAQRIAGDLNLARTQAKISSAGQTVVFNVASNNYSLPGMAALPGQPSPYTVNLSSDPYGALLLTAVFGSGSTMSFDRFGQPATGGTVTVQSGAFVKTITVDPNTGLATTQ